MQDNQVAGDSHSNRYHFQMLPSLPPIKNETAFGSKQCDFIKKVKRTKSIMMAQKNRKLKYVMNQYRHDHSIKIVSDKYHRLDSLQHLKNRERAATEPKEMSSSVSISALQKQQMLRKISSMVYEPVDLGAYLVSITNHDEKFRSSSYKKDIPKVRHEENLTPPAKTKSILVKLPLSPDVKPHRYNIKHEPARIRHFNSKECKSFEKKREDPIWMLGRWEIQQEQENLNNISVPDFSGEEQ